MPTLLVVDMQPGFTAAEPDWMIEHVGREIRASMVAGHAIIFLEYTYICQPAGVAVKNATDRRLTGLVTEYDKAIVAHKPTQDGSEQAVIVIKGLMMYGGRYNDEIRVVGVETNICVMHTVNGLAERLPDTRIVVVGDACNICRNVAGPNNEGQDGIVASGNVAILKVA